MYNIWTYRPLSGGSLTDLENNLEDQGAGIGDTDRFNPYIQTMNEVNEYTNRSLSSNVYLEYSFAKNFKLKLTGGINIWDDERRQFYNSQTRLGSNLSSLGILNGPNGSINSNNFLSYQNENLLFYTKKNQQKSSFECNDRLYTSKNTSKARWFTAIQVPNESLGINGLYEGIAYRVGESSTTNTILSYLGRINYSYQGKYLLTLTMRADGSSKFVGNHRWGYFPSGAIAWRFSDEPFMGKLNFVSEAKLRASYGFTGNNRIGDLLLMQE